MSLLEITKSIQEDLADRIMDEYLVYALAFASVFAVSKIIINIFPYLSAPEKEWNHTKIFSPVLLLILLLFYPSFIDFNRKIMGSFAEIEVNSNTKLCITNFTSIESDIINVGKEKLEEEEKIAYAYQTNIGGITTEYDEDEEEDYDEDETNFDLDCEEEFENNEDTWIAEKLKEFVYFLGSVAKVIIICLQTIFLSILEIGGPIAVCMSLFPSLESSFKKWYGIYLQTFLWLPITNIIDTVIVAINSGSDSNDTSGLWQFSLTVALLVSYLLVPKISSFFVSSKGGDGMANMAISYSYKSVTKAIKDAPSLKNILKR